MSDKFFNELEEAIRTDPELQKNRQRAEAYFLYGKIPDRLKIADDVFHENAEDKMVQYNHSEFKRTHPTLYKVILQSMDEYAKLYHQEMMEML